MNYSARYNEVSVKLNKMFKGQSEEKKDELVKGLKFWLKQNSKSNDKGKIDAINNYLAEICVF